MGVKDPNVDKVFGYAGQGIQGINTGLDIGKQLGIFDLQNLKKEKKEKEKKERPPSFGIDHVAAGLGAIGQVGGLLGVKSPEFGQFLGIAGTGVGLAKQFGVKLDLQDL